MSASKTYSAGTAWLQVVPSFADVEDKLGEQAAKLGKRLEKSLGEVFPDDNAQGRRRAARAGEQAGTNYGGSFGKTAIRQIEAAWKSLPEPTPNMRKWDKQIQQVRQDLRALWADATAGNIDPKRLVAGAESAADRLRFLQSNAKNAADFHNTRDAGRQLESFLDIADDAARRGAGAGRGFGGAFAENFSRQVEQAIADLPAFPLRANGKEARDEIARIRDELVRLADKAIGIDIDPDKAFATIAKLRAQLAALAAREYNVDVEIKMASGTAGDRLGRVLGEDARKQGDQAGGVFVGAFETHLKTSLEHALSAIPETPLRVNTSDAGARLAELRLDLESLADKTIGVDVDAADAYREFLQIHAALRQLESEDVDLDVRVNAAAAADGMARLANESDNAKGQIGKMDQQAKLTMSRLGLLIGLSASLGSVTVPAAAAAAGAIGFIGTMALGGLAGVGALALGLQGVGDAVKAMDQEQLNADKSSRSLTQAHNGVRKAADGVKRAEENLARVRTRVNEQAIDAAKAVRDAEDGVADARRDAARQARDSARAVVDAQRTLTEAEADAREVREGLNQAYKDAARDLENLKSKIANNALDQQKATTEIMKAKEELDKLLANPRATELEKRQAKDAYDARVLQLKDLQLESKQLGQDLADANKKGLEGSDQVVAVRKRIEDADKRVADAQEKLTRAREKATEQQQDAAERVADAQQRVADAQLALARGARDGAQQIQDASRGVVDAREAEASAVEAVGVAGGEAYRNLNQALDSLSPAGKRFARFLFGLKDEAISLRDAAQENLLPGLQEAITLALPYLPGLEKFIGKVAEKVGDLAVQSVKAFGGGTWQRFFQFIDQTATDSLQTLFEIGSNVAEGLVALYMALTPFNAQVGNGLVKMTADFAKWAKELDRSRGYQDFLAYVREQGPEVVELLINLGKAVVKIVEALGPLGAMMIDTVNLFAEFVDAIPEPLLTAFVTGLGLAAAGVLALSAAIRIGKFKREIGDIFGPAAQRMVQTYAIETGRADEKTGRFGKALATAGGVAEKARGKFRRAGGALADLTGFMTGPVGLSVTAATTYLGIFADKAAENKQRVDTFTEALAALRDEFADLKAEGKDTSEALDEAFKRAVMANPDLQAAVKTLNEMGLSYQQLMDAATSGDPSEVIRRINDEIERQNQITVDAKGANSWFGGNEENKKAYEAAKTRIQQLTAMRDAFKQNAEAIGLSSEAQRILNDQESRHNALIEFQRQHPWATPSEINAQTAAYDQNAARVAVLTGIVDAFGDGQEDAGRKSDALRTAIEAQTSSAIDATEASENWHTQLINLRESVKSNGKTIDENSRAGLANRDAIQAAAKSAREFYLEEIASGKPIDEVTRKHNDRIQALKDEAKKLGLTQKETNDLIDLYGNVPDDVKTVYRTDGFKKVWDELSQLKFIQEALNKGWTVEQAKIEWSKLRSAGLGPGPTMGPPKKAEGGRITGPGTGTSDDVLMYGSNGEWVHRAAAVGYYGDGFMSAINNMEIPKEWLPGFSTGGKVMGGDGASQIPAYATGGKVKKRTMSWPAEVDVTKTDIPALDEVMSVGGTGPLGSAGGGVGWRWQMAMLRKVFPGLDLYSGFRRNSYTSSGSLSWHSRDGGRAVDVPPRQDVFNYIHDTYGKNTKELIWGGDPTRNIYRGKHHRFSDSLLYRHGPYRGKNGPSPHVHWAFDNGGWLEPGMRGVNLLNEPEPVLTPWQWDAIEAFVNQGMSGGRGHTYNFDFANSTLTPERFNAIQQRQDALERAGLPY